MGKSTTEKIIGSLIGVNGHTFDIVYDLFFTTERVIVFTIQHPGDLPRHYPSLWQTVFIGSGWEVRQERRELEKTAQARRRTSPGLTPEELVSAYPRNFYIRYSEITSVEIRRRFLQSQLRFSISKPSTTGRVTRFNLTRKQIPEAQRLLELVLPSKTREK